MDKKLQLQIRLDMRTRQTLAFPVNYRNTAVPPKTSNPVSGTGIGNNSNWNPDWLNNGKFLNTSAPEHIFNDIALL